MISNNSTSVLAGQDSAIRAVFDEVSSAWGDGDADAFAGWYADDATVILPGSTCRARTRSAPAWRLPSPAR